MKLHELRISGEIHKALKEHLFPGDGKEAVAVLICGRHENDNLSILLSHKLHLIPYNKCERNTNYVRWKTEEIRHVIEEASLKDMAILKIHSHPTGYSKFSETDNISDNILFNSLFGWADSNLPHASSIMLPDGEVFGRVFYPDLIPIDFHKVSISGDQILKWYKKNDNKENNYSLRTIQAFGQGTYNIMKQLKIGIIGCSGTGSPTFEQLHRLGVGELVLIDPKEIKIKNLNRILYSKMSDAEKGKLKTTLFSEVIKETGLDTKLKVFPINLFDSRVALDELIKCDVLFGCVDSIDGRNLISQLSNFYLIPYIDMGVKLDADGNGGITKISGAVHYIQPACSSLMSRGVFTPIELSSHSLFRTDPEEFKDQLERGYIRNVNVDNPAVISMNMQISSMAINEFLNRIHPYKEDDLDNYAKIAMDFSDCSICCESESSFPKDLINIKWAGRGDCVPFLRMMELEGL
ncbi:MAG: ThiF family adenylyltransferase [bacterium]|nr:ThiF family adenylyltransferase [bacterium]